MGAWHTGAELEDVAARLRARGHTVHCPTLAGNRPGDDRGAIGLQDAAQSVVDYIRAHQLTGIRLVGHSYGGMVISVVSQLIPEAITRLVCVNAFVPNPGESLNDMVPPHYVALFDQIAAASGGAVMLPEPIWREAFINDADAALAHATYGKLSWHPRLSEKLGLYRYIECVGSHEAWFTEPQALAEAIEKAGRD